MRRPVQLLAAVAAAALLAGCQTPDSTNAQHTTDSHAAPSPAPAGLPQTDSSGPPSRQDPRHAEETQTGLASFSGQDFQGKQTASGETFDPNALMAAHPSFPLGTRVRVTNLANGREVEVRITDRGPSPDGRQEGIIIDVSQGAAQELGFVQDGKVRVRVDVLEWGSEREK